MGRTHTVLSALATLAMNTLVHEPPTSTVAPASRNGCEAISTRTRAGWVVEVSIRAARACCRP